MYIVQLTPGTGDYYSGAALRDHALVTALRRLGHKVHFVPLYQEILTEAEEVWEETPLFYELQQVYRRQQSGLVNRLQSLLCRKGKAARKIERMTPSQRGDLIISLLRGASGRQAGELKKLLKWLQQQRPEVLCLSNALLLGLAPRLRAELNVPIVLSLQGEFRQLESLPKARREEAWEIMRAAAADVGAFIAPSAYYAKLMQEKLKLPEAKLQIIPNGILLNQYSVAPAPPAKPTLGFLARLCAANGLELLVNTFKKLKKTRFPELQLRVAGGLSDGDLAFLAKLLKPLHQTGLAEDIKVLPNVPMSQKISFLQGLSLLCVPAADDAFGTYLLEAMAVGVPVVQPRRGAYAEIIERTGGGILCEPDDPQKLRKAIGDLLADEAKRVELGKTGRQGVLEHYSIEQMAGEMLKVFDKLKSANQRPAENAADSAAAEDKAAAKDPPSE